ncbi:MAG: DUF2835 domain-containing protein [Gammaproteobacteria bacterium]|nr:DUF2835 domain-containing protein [Gammaproteobacteria bacterium]
MPRKFKFNLKLSAEKVQHIYGGQARYILVYTDDGISLQLPASNFRQYVTERGIHGQFEVEIDDKNKLISLRII